MSQLKEYLGDSVYADFDGNAIILTTENGGAPSNTIYLEYEQILALDRFADKLKRLAQERQNENPNP